MWCLLTLVQFCRITNSYKRDVLAETFAQAKCPFWIPPRQVMGGCPKICHFLSVLLPTSVILNWLIDYPFHHLRKKVMWFGREILECVSDFPWFGDEYHFHVSKTIRAYANYSWCIFLIRGRNGIFSSYKFVAVKRA